MFVSGIGNLARMECECGLVYFRQRWPHDFNPSTPAPIPLESVSILASVVHAVAQVELTQIYVNKEQQPIEAIYFFPMDSNGGVTHFQAEVEGRIIKGVVKPQEEAKALYDKAVSEKQTAFLLDSNKPDIFKVKIGFLKPGSKVKVVIGYVTEVENEKGSNAQRFFIPTTVAPRYVPQGNMDAKSNELNAIKYSGNTPAPLTITVNVSLQGGIKALESPTHQITVTEKASIPEKPSWTRAVVQLTGTITDMDRDFVLMITPAEIHAPRLYAEKFEKSTALMAHLIPSFNFNDQKVELIFILDRSGSMNGRSIELAKRALMLFLHSAPVHCYFNIVGFGSSFQFLFPASVKYEEYSFRSAVYNAQALQANLGGTELLQPLREVFNKPLIPGYLRQIFVLTDGEISNTEAVLGLTKANAHLGRLFALGIGDGCSHHLVEGLAEAGGGTASFVTYNESIDSKVLQQLKNAIQPSLSEVRIEWIGVPDSEFEQPRPKLVMEKTLLGYGKPIQNQNGQDSETKKTCYQVPGKVPPIYDGTQLLVFGLFESTLPTGVRITAESPDGPLSIEVKLDPAHNLGSTGMLHKLAAINLVRELEMKINALSSGCYRSGEYPGLSAESLRKEIIAISCRHGISSKYTSFIAVDVNGNKEVNENWIMQTRQVASQYPNNGWYSGSSAMATPFFSSTPSMYPGTQLTNNSAMMSGFGFGQGPTQMQHQQQMSQPCFQQSMQPYQQQQLQQQQQQSQQFHQTFNFASTAVPAMAAPMLGNTTPSASSFSFGSPAPAPQQVANFPFGRSSLSFGSPASPQLMANSAFGSSSFSFGFSAPQQAENPSFGRASFKFSTPATQVANTALFGRTYPAVEPVTFSFSTTAPSKMLRSEDKLHALVATQSFNGSFHLNEAFAKSIGQTLDSIQQEATKYGYDGDAFATALALAYFKHKLIELKDSWELVEAKARKWLVNNFRVYCPAILIAAEKFVLNNP